MGICVGTTPSSWGVWFPNDPRQPPWEQYLDEVVEAGYEWIELGSYGYLPTEGGRLNAELRARSLRIAAGHTRTFLDLTTADAWPEIERQATELGTLLAEGGANYFMVLPASYRDPVTGAAMGTDRLSPDAHGYLVDNLHRLAAFVQSRFCLHIVFHPHIETPIEYEDQIDTLLAATDPALVSLCLDTGHCAYRAGDPVAFMRRHHARIPYLHLKDLNPSVHRAVQESGLSFGEAVKRSVFCEPPTGALNFPALREVLHDVHFNGVVIVEQGMYPLASFDIPLPIARRTRAYLRTVGIG